MKKYVLRSLPQQHSIWSANTLWTISMILKVIKLYLFIEPFNFQTVCCVVSVLKIPFISSLYLIFWFIIHCSRCKIQILLIPKLYLKVINVLWMYKHIKCIYANYIVHIMNPWLNMDNLYEILLTILVDGNGVAIILISLITKSVFIQLQWNKNHWILIRNANETV